MKRKKITTDMIYEARIKTMQNLKLVPINETLILHMYIDQRLTLHKIGSLLQISYESVRKILKKTYSTIKCEIKHA
jgi:DNA-directed RNA polymerase sigma subunit (sigma70/sigma32)